MTENRSWVGSNPAWCLGGSGFRSWPGQQLSQLRFFFNAFPQSHQIKSGIVSEITTGLLPSTSFLIHYLLTNTTIWCYIKVIHHTVAYGPVARQRTWNKQLYNLCKQQSLLANGHNRCTCNNGGTVGGSVFLCGPCRGYITGSGCDCES
jgi:hypothetical protein